MIPFPEKKYSVIYADPPWNYAAGGKTRNVERHYRTMKPEDIYSLPVQDIAEDDCLLFLWATFPNLDVALETIRRWGFQYKTAAFVWVKRNRKSPSWFWGLGNWTRANAEICLLATKGKPKRASASVHSIIDMNKLKRFKIGLFTITLGMVLVGASFALADDKAVAEGIYLPEELNETTAILTPSVAIAENEPTTQPEEWIDAVATAYCPCEICCGKWALNRPDGIVYTASGAIAEEGVTIAADWSVYSPGTILYIEGIGERTVQDRGGAISGQKIDVFFNSHEDALRFGRQEVRIKVISDTER
jgi:3D (Asp-Asp-Asp) domain-containing protein